MYFCLCIFVHPNCAKLSARWNGKSDFQAAPQYHQYHFYHRLKSHNDERTLSKVNKLASWSFQFDSMAFSPNSWGKVPKNWGKFVLLTVLGQFDTNPSNPSNLSNPPNPCQSCQSFQSLQILPILPIPIPIGLILATHEQFLIKKPQGWTRTGVWMGCDKRKVKKWINWLQNIWLDQVDNFLIKQCETMWKSNWLQNVLLELSNTN